MCCKVWTRAQLGKSQDFNTANTKYEFSVAADYGICTGEMSAPSEECTTDAAVAPPSDVMLTISFREIMQIKWKSPSFISEGHFVKKYKVKYHPANATNIVQYEEVETEGAKCLYTLANLSPDTTYRISVFAVCEDGSESAPSCVFEIATAHTNPPAPGPPELDEKTHNTVRLKWTHDINDATHINSYMYVLTYKETSGESWESFHTADSKKTATVPGLRPNTAYEFLVVADYGICKGDTSVSSDPYMTYAASSPSDLRTIFYAFRSKIKVVWNQPTSISDGLIVKRYKIRYERAHQYGGVDIKESKDDKPYYWLHDLLPNTAYLVSVSAVCSEDGENAYSTPVEMNTFDYIIIDSNRYEYERDDPQLFNNQRIGRPPFHDHDSNSHKDEENGGIVRRMWHYFRGRISKKIVLSRVQKQLYACIAISFIPFLLIHIHIPTILSKLNWLFKMFIRFAPKIIQICVVVVRALDST